MSFPFVHLRVHSDYSLGNGTSKVKDLVQRAKDLRQPALALTDAKNLHGAMQFSKAAIGAGIQPIVGVHIDVKVGDKGKKGSLLLLAQDEVGYANICKIHHMSIAPGNQPELSLDNGCWRQIFAAEKEGRSITQGIIAIGGVGADGFLRAAYEGRLPDVEIEKFVRLIAGRFPGRFYVEICRNGYPEGYDSLNEKRALELASQLSLPIVATTDVWYADPSRHDAYEILRSVESKDVLDVTDEGLKTTSSRRYHLRDSNEMLSLFDDLPEAYHNACTIARRCAFKVDGRKPILPPFESGERSEAEEMRRQAHEGLRMRFERHGIPADRHAEYQQRLEYELDVIEQMGFPGYFLIVSDFIKYAKANGIPVGPGRGSGAGSVVAWALTITDLDPLRFGLLFERFLNPERVSMPDFDIDFCQDRREEVIDYVRQKYGDDKVAQIVTFQEIKSKNAIKDAARVISTPFGQMSPRESNSITGLVQNKEGAAEPMKLKEAYSSTEAFRDAIESNEVSRTVYRYALEIEGLYRNAGAHAAGVVIAGKPLTDLVPVGFDPKKHGAVVQYNMKDAETAGLVKFDFLGLKTLSVIREAVENIERTTGERIDIDNVPYEDPAVYQMLSDGLSSGVFQLESEGMKRVLRQIKPTQIEDLIAVVSLYRPGPMESIPTYAERKNSPEPRDDWYPEPVDRTKLFLGETYGIMVYQEQVMQVAQVVAGYSLGGADLLRRAMGKKIKEEMDKQKEMFVSGAEKNGTPAKKAADLFELIAKFAGYGFNKSHAAAYAAVSFQTAWLKRHYPAQFFAALLTYETDNADKMSLIKHDMDQFDVKLLPPDVNKSHMRFRPEQDEHGKWNVRFGLTAVKQITNNPDFIAEREARGPFKDLVDFHERVGAMFSSSHLQKLAEAGAFISITPGGVRRRAVSVLAFLAKNGKASKDTGTASMFDDLDAKIVIPKKELEVEEWNDILVREHDAVGFFFRGHPLDAREEKMKRKGGIRTKAAITEYMRSKRMGDFDNRKIRGMVEKVHKEAGFQGRGERITVTLAERYETYRVNIYYPKDQTIEDVYSKLQGAKSNSMPVVIVAKFVTRDDGFSIYGQQVFQDDEYIALAMGSDTMEIVVDTDAMDLDSRSNRHAKEKEAMLELQERAQRINADPGALLDEVAALLAPRMSMLLEDLQRLLAPCQTEDAKSPEVIIRVLTRVGNFRRARKVKLMGHYAIEAGVRNAIAQIRGVTNIEDGESEGVVEEVAIQQVALIAPESVDEYA